MATKFIGRDKELALLEQTTDLPKAQLIVLHGRRRIGKSRLIDEFAKSKTYYHFTGLAPGKGVTAQMQRNEFARKLNEYFKIRGLKADDWADLFTILAQQCSQTRAVVLFDEISWMGMKDPTFLSKLRNAWDREFKQNNQLTLVLCGSISSWIEKNILTSTGFVGRVNQVLRLNELPLSDCSKFWGASNNIAPYEKFKLLAVTGGVPLYLEAIDPTLTAEENIRRLCFTSGGLLVREFNNIFSDLFTKRSKMYTNIVRALTNGPAEIAEISKQIGIEQTGWLSDRLNDLQMSGFIARDFTWDMSKGTEAKLSHYRLSDNYLRFYLKYIEKNINIIEQHDYEFKSITSLPGWSTMLGYQFENLVLKNRPFIKEQLNIKSDEIVSDNPFFQNKTTKQPGCQIDYLIQTKYNNLYVCEIKFSKDPIGLSVIEEVQEKIDRLRRPKGFSCRPVLIHVNGINEKVSESDYFAKIISFEDILAS